MREEDKRDYPEFNDKIITWSTPGWKGGMLCKVRVIGCDFHIGVSLVNPENKDDFFHCMSGPLSKRGKDKLLNEREYNWEEAFEDMVASIRVGHVEARAITNLLYGDGDFGSGGPSASTCAFGA